MSKPRLPGAYSMRVYETTEDAYEEDQVALEDELPSASRRVVAEEDEDESEDEDYVHDEGEDDSGGSGSSETEGEATITEEESTVEE